MQNIHEPNSNSTNNQCENVEVISLTQINAYPGNDQKNNGIERIMLEDNQKKEVSVNKKSKKIAQANKQFVHRGKVYSKGHWTKEEKEQFDQAIIRHGNLWESVQKEIPTRSCIQIRSHAQKYANNAYLEALRMFQESGQKGSKLFMIYRDYARIHRRILNDPYELSQEDYVPDSRRRKKKCPNVDQPSQFLEPEQNHSPIPSTEDYLPSFSNSTAIENSELSPPALPAERNLEQVQFEEQKLREENLEITEENYHFNLDFPPTLRDLEDLMFDTNGVTRPIYNSP